MDFLSRLGGKKVDPIEEAKKWKRGIGKEIRVIERGMLDIEREEKKIMKEIQKLAAQGESRRGAVKILAKDLVRSRKAKEKMLNGKVMLNSVQMQIQMQISTVKVAGCMQKSAEVLSSMNNLIKIPQISQACRDMAREMEKAGLIEEMIGDAMDMTDGTEEEEVDLEVQKVLDEVAASVMSSVPLEPTKPVAAPAAQEAEDEAARQAEEEREAAELEQMKQRLNAL